MLLDLFGVAFGGAKSSSRLSWISRDVIKYIFAEKAAEQVGGFFGKRGVNLRLALLVYVGEAGGYVEDAL